MGVSRMTKLEYIIFERSPSNNYKGEDLFALLDIWIEHNVPTAIIGDINENLGKLKKQPFLKKMMSIGFEQQIKEPTCQTGSLLDHLYINDAMKVKDFSTEITLAYYSDHDIVSLYISKQE